MARKSEGYRARRLAARRSQRWGAYQNLVLYALCLDYKDDQVHAPFIMRRWAGRP